MTAPTKINGRTEASRMRQCGKKNRYADEFAARAMGRYLCEQKPGLQLWLYHCPVCSGWHLTKSAPGDRHSTWRDVNYDYNEDKETT